MGIWLTQTRACPCLPREQGNAHSKPPGAFSFPTEDFKTQRSVEKSWTAFPSVLLNFSSDFFPLICKDLTPWCVTEVIQPCSQASLSSAKTQNYEKLISGNFCEVAYSISYQKLCLWKLIHLKNLKSTLNSAPEVQAYWSCHQLCVSPFFPRKRGKTWQQDF